jgi:hypothetical protein
MSHSHQAKLIRATRLHPCPVCGKDSNCSFTEDGVRAICRRVSAGALKENRDGSFTHVLKGHEGVYTPPGSLPKPTPAAAPIERRHAVYTALLAALPLSGRHTDNLLGRGLSDTEVARNGYASLPASGQEALDLCRDLAARHDLCGVPGFFRDHEGRWYFRAMRPGFFIPVRDARGRIQAMQTRQDSGTRYLWFSSAEREGGASSGAPVHFARPWRVASCGEAVITEGPLKADIIAEQLDACVVAVAGVSSFREDFGHWLRAQLPAVRQVFIAFDLDWHFKPEVGRATLRLMAAVEDAGLSGSLLNWDGAKGLDDLLTLEVSHG